ncbi:MAG: hypothetical protein AB7O97_22300 [Planctomycetota bacterium]
MEMGAPRSPGVLYGSSHVLAVGLLGGLGAQCCLLARNESLLPSPRLPWRAVAVVGVLVEGCWGLMAGLGSEVDLLTAAYVGAIALMAVLSGVRFLPLRGRIPMAVQRDSVDLAWAFFGVRLLVVGGVYYLFG